MKKDNSTEDISGETHESGYTGRGYACAAAVLTAGGAVALGLIFTVLGIYSLIASVILSLSALTFINVQKRKNDFAKLKIFKVCAYVVLGVAVAIFVGGLIWSAI